MKFIRKLLLLSSIVSSSMVSLSADCQSECEIVGKPVVYQVFTRLFGNRSDINKPWGTIEENGVGKFNDFTDVALRELHDLGVTHMWYTGVPHHAVIRDYTEYGISSDDPDVVKGRAGSPYAVKDYYQVNPDLAVDPSIRMEEFEALIARTHEAKMKVLIDIVPNHVARGYKGTNNPEGVDDFGIHDDVSVEYKRDNNFYYVVGEPFKVPDFPEDYMPLGGDEHPLSDQKFDENPAKWTGNGSRLAQPNFNDWYETVKINYGVRPDGTYDFDRLPEEFKHKDYSAHYEFWEGKDVPDSWVKFRDITLFWVHKGVDGFRFDMAEMVPVEFWSYLNSNIKNTNPDAFLLAEVYQPDLYRDYIHLGKMDYLYDKVELYDTLKDILRGKAETKRIAEIQDGLADIEHHMLHFLENHDEQRIASPEFAGNAARALPLLVVSATISSSPTMIYFAQEVGEDGSEEPGFGDPSRSSIFDYMGIPSLQRWINDGKFDGGRLTEAEAELRSYYKRLLNYTRSEPVMNGAYAEIHSSNLDAKLGYPGKAFSFVRWTKNQHAIVICNFDDQNGYEFVLKIPADQIQSIGLSEGSFPVVDVLSGKRLNRLTVKKGVGKIGLNLKPSQSLIIQMAAE